MTTDAGCTPCCCIVAPTDCCYPDASRSLVFSYFERISSEVNGVEKDVYEIAASASTTLFRGPVPAYGGTGNPIGMKSVGGTFSYSFSTSEKVFRSPVAGTNCPGFPNDYFCPECLETRLSGTLNESSSGALADGSIYIRCEKICSSQKKPHHLYLTLSGEGTRTATQYFEDGSSSSNTETTAIGNTFDALGNGGCLNASTFANPNVASILNQLGFSYPCTQIITQYWEGVATQCGDAIQCSPPSICAALNAGLEVPEFSDFNAQTCPVVACLNPLTCFTFDCAGDFVINKECGCNGIPGSTSTSFNDANANGGGTLVFKWTRSVSITYG